MSTWRSYTAAEKLKVVRYAKAEFDGISEAGKRPSLAALEGYTGGVTNT